MKRMSVLVIAAGLAFAGCDNKAAPVQNSPNTVAIFTATLLPANEVPAIANAENTGSGSVTITVNITNDSTEEDAEDFLITLSAPTGGAQLSATDATTTIVSERATAAR